jgi:hypothetical protein
MLRPVKNDTAALPFCGPVVVASITGKPVSKVLDAIQRNRHGAHWKRRKDVAPIVSTSSYDLARALRHFGWRMQEVDVDGIRSAGEAAGMVRAVNWTGWQPLPRASTLTMPTLAAWLRKRKPEDMKAAFVIQIDHHWIAIAGRKLCDTHTGGSPVFIRKAPHRRARVRKVYRVERIA